jgi:hypothetical protein
VEASAAAVLHDLASVVVASCPGTRLLVRSVPAGQPVAAVTGTLTPRTPLSVLDGSDVHDLARADAAVLLVGLGRATAQDVAAAVRHLGRRDVPIIGVVTTPGASAERTPAAAPARPHGPLDRLVAGAETGLSGAALAPAADPGVSTDTTPMQAIPQPGGTS